jgi:hypothetical protein
MAAIAIAAQNTLVEIQYVKRLALAFTGIVLLMRLSN